MSQNPSYHTGCPKSHCEKVRAYCLAHGHLIRKFLWEYSRKVAHLRSKEIMKIEHSRNTIRSAKSVFIFHVFVPLPCLHHIPFHTFVWSIDHRYTRCLALTRALRARRARPQSGCVAAARAACVSTWLGERDA